jgi:hypothetical protein
MVERHIFRERDAFINHNSTFFGHYYDTLDGANTVMRYNVRIEHFNNLVTSADPIPHTCIDLCDLVELHTVTEFDDIMNRVVDNQDAVYEAAIDRVRNQRPTVR